MGTSALNFIIDLKLKGADLQVVVWPLHLQLINGAIQHCCQVLLCKLWRPMTVKLNDRYL